MWKFCGKGTVSAEFRAKCDRQVWKKEKRRDEFNQHLHRCSVRFRPFQGAKVSQMTTFVHQILTYDTPYVVIIHADCNDISDRKITPHKIGDGIMDSHQLCRQLKIIVIKGFYFFPFLP